MNHLAYLYLWLVYPAMILIYLSNLVPWPKFIKYNHKYKVDTLSFW